MRVLFVYPHRYYNEYPLGLLYLSAVLKEKGHDTRLLSLNSCQASTKDNPQTSLERGLQEQITCFVPDMIGFSVMTHAIDTCLRLARVAKERGCFVVFGGPHPTVAPEEMVAQEMVDAICIGEGEYALLELVTNLESQKDITNIQNIWIKNRTGIHRNSIRCLISDLDSLPFPDREILDLEHLHPKSMEFRGANFFTSRGCPYKCSFCWNSYLQSLYRGCGPFVRFRRVTEVINEIKGVVKKYNPAKVVFSDEMFTLKKQRLLAFCEAYAREVALPFYCQSRANAIDEEIVTALKTANCELISIGIESGNDYIRNEVLNRKMSQATIKTAFRLLKQAEIHTGSFNMIGMPFESEAMIRQTIKINRELRPDILHCTVIMPFKGTPIRRIYEENRWLETEPTDGYYNQATQRLPNISSSKLLAYQRLFDLFVYTPRWSRFVVELLLFLWGNVPLKDKKISFPRRVIRSLAYRLTPLVRKWLLPPQS